MSHYLAHVLARHGRAKERGRCVDLLFFRATARGPLRAQDDFHHGPRDHGDEPRTAHRV